MQKTITFPFKLPKSLESHLELFEIDKPKAILSLERHLKRRAYDAVGHFLLAWFYLKNGDNSTAIELAIKAKTFAPGSPFFENLPYFFSHPSEFEAWLPDLTNDYHFVRRPHTNTTNLKVDLDGLINKLSSLDLSNTTDNDKYHTLSEKQQDDFDLEIATETLARIYENQKEIEKAIHIYEKIKLQKPDKSSYCDEQISRLNRLV